VTDQEQADLLEFAITLNDLSLGAESYYELVLGLEAAVSQVMGPVNVGFALHIDEGQYLQLLPGSYNGADVELVASSQVELRDMVSASARAMRTGRGFFTQSATENVPEFVDWFEGLGIKELMTVPVQGRTGPLGLLHVANKPGGFAEADLDFVERASPFVAATVEQVRSRTDMRRSEALATTISEVAAGIAAGRSLQDMHSSLLTRFCEVADVNLLAISFMGESCPRVLIVRGEVADAVRSEFLGEALSHRRAARMQVRGVRSSGIGDVGTTRAHVPVIAAGQYHACLSVLRTPASPFSTAEQKAMRRLGRVVSMAWATESYRREHDLRARADERHRIADELHDQVAQILFSAKLSMESLIESIPDTSTELLTGAEKARSLLTRSEVSLREWMSRLSPQERTRLTDQLHSIAHEVEEEFGLAIRVQVSQTDRERLAGVPESLSGAVLRATREGMVNAAKHAQPCKVMVLARTIGTETLEVTVSDDGRDDISTDRAGHGIDSVRRLLREHGGTLELSRSSGGITFYRVTAPLAWRS
jgi:signal transduction histidine kinase